MDNINLRPYSAPIVTGTPAAAATPSGTAQPEGLSFQEILQQRLAAGAGPMFSRHAVNRVTERNIDMSQGNIERLNEGVRLAEQKGLKEPLILVGGTAFIVSVENNTVITTVEGNELKGSVFTNIDGTVII